MSTIKEKWIEFTSAARTYGNLRNATIFESQVESSTGLLSYAPVEDVYALDINGGRPERELLYPSWRARTNGLVNGKKAYLIDECCLPNDDQMTLGCPDLTGPVELLIRLAVSYVEYTWAGNVFDSFDYPTGVVGELGNLDIITVGTVDALAAYAHGDPTLDIEDPGFYYFGDTSWQPACIGARGTCWTVPDLENGGFTTDPAILFYVEPFLCEEYPTGTTLTGGTSVSFAVMTFILPITNENVSESLGNPLLTYYPTIQYGNRVGATIRASAAGDKIRVYYYDAEIL